MIITDFSKPELITYDVIDKCYSKDMYGRYFIGVDLINQRYLVEQLIDDLPESLKEKALKMEVDMKDSFQATIFPTRYSILIIKFFY